MSQPTSTPSTRELFLRKVEFDEGDFPYIGAAPTMQRCSELAAELANARLTAVHAAVADLVEAAENSCQCTYKQVAKNDWVTRMAVDEECSICKALALLREVCGGQ